MSKCKSINCDKELEGGQRNYCSNRCKQAVKNAINRGKQCKNCFRPISKPTPVLGGYEEYCSRRGCEKMRRDYGSQD